MSNEAEVSSVADLVKSLAAAKSLPPPHPRDDWWDDAKAIGRDPNQQKGLMAIAGWLAKAGYRDRWLRVAVFREGVGGRIRNPFMYFKPGSKALESLVGRMAEQRHLAEKKAITEQEARMGIAR